MQYFICKFHILLWIIKLLDFLKFWLKYVFRKLFLVKKSINTHNLVIQNSEGISSRFLFIFKYTGLINLSFRLYQQLFAFGKTIKHHCYFWPNFFLYSGFHSNWLTYSNEKVESYPWPHFPHRTSTSITLRNITCLASQNSFSSSISAYSTWKHC